jgi:hypothetical protein
MLRHNRLDRPVVILQPTLETSAKCGRRFALGIPCNQVAGHEGGCSWSDHAVNTGAAQKEETLREGVDRTRRELRCKACGAVGEPGSPDYCSLECYEESH